jgi:hypothetical protein
MPLKEWLSGRFRMKEEVKEEIRRNDPNQHGYANSECYYQVKFCGIVVRLSVSNQYCEKCGHTQIRDQCH